MVDYVEYMEDKKVGETRNILGIHIGAKIKARNGSLMDDARYYAFDIGKENEVCFYGVTPLVKFLREAKRVLQEDGVAEVDLW